MRLLPGRERLTTAQPYRPRRQEHLQPIVQQPSRRRVRRFRLGRTALLDPAVPGAALQQRAMMYLVHRVGLRRRVCLVPETRLVREETQLGMKAHLVRKTHG